MNIQLVWLSVATLFLNLTSLAQAAGSPQLSYDLDLSLQYLDILQNPFSTEGLQQPNQLSRLEAAESRSLGLKQMRMGVRWAYPGHSQLNLILRPDSSLREDQADYDTRAGTVYFKKQPVELLDAYSIDLLFLDSAVLSFGVFEQMVRQRSAYTHEPEFGLEVILPTKFAGAYLQWRFDKHDGDYSQQMPNTGLIFDLWVHQGAGDRVEQEVSKDKTHDTGPGANDPHLGVAAGVRWVRTASHRLGILLGGGDSHYVDSTGEGKRNEVYARLYNEFMWAVDSYLGKTSFEVRILKEKWTGDQINLPSRTHQSGRLTNSLQVVPQGWVLLGFHYGRSKFDSSLWVHGYQFDLGYQKDLRNGIELSLIAAEERRSHLEQGKSRGGFVRNDGTRERSVRRFLIELSYLLGGI